MGECGYTCFDACKKVVRQMSAKSSKSKNIADTPLKKKAKRMAKPPVRSADDVNSFTGRKRVRRSFGKIREVAQIDRKSVV